MRCTLVWVKVFARPYRTQVDHSPKTAGFLAPFILILEGNGMVTSILPHRRRSSHRCGQRRLNQRLFLPRLLEKPSKNIDAIVAEAADGTPNCPNAPSCEIADDETDEEGHELPMGTAPAEL